mgnify:CR=1 FL=1
MTKNELIKLIKEKLLDVKKYRKDNELLWKEKGIDLDEVDYKKPSSHSNVYLTNAHRNDTAIKQKEWFLELLSQLDEL